ncbi:MAG: glutathione S-transferase family protein [Pseudomonadota bacterium]
MSIRLHGVSISNYYSTVKAGLVEKGLDFEEVPVMPTQTPEVLAHSPMGKVPWIEIDGQDLSETSVIFDYIEECHPQPPLYPTDPWARAKTREIMRVVEMYLDSAVRPHLPAVYFGAPVDQGAYDSVPEELNKGLVALKKVAQFAPYIAGAEFTYADITAFFQIGFTNLHTTRIYDRDIIDEVAGLADYLALVRERASLREVADQMQSDLDSFFSKTD